MNRSRLSHVESLETRRLLTASAVSSLPQSYFGADLDVYSSSDSVAYFSLATTATGSEVWQTDGTTEGTRLTRDLVPGIFASRPQSIVTLADRVFFLAFGSASADAQPAYHLWTARHDEPAVALVADQEIAHSELLPFGEQIAFVDLQTNRIWTSDGTEQGTIVRSEPIQSIQQTSFGVQHDSFSMTAVGDTVFVTSESDAQLRRWTGGAKVDIIGDFSDGGQFSHIDVKQLGNQTWLRVSGTNGSQLHKYDPASGDFLLVHEWQSGYLSWNDARSFDSNMVFTLSGIQVPRVRYSAQPYEFTNKQLWITDGTTTGTTQISMPDSGMITATHYGETGLAYIQLGPDGSYDLWHLPSVDDSPRKLHEFSRIVGQHERSLTSLGSDFFFVDGSNVVGEPASLYRFDGSSNETQQVKTFADGIISGLQVHNQQLLFTANDGNGAAIWFSDGTISRTRLVRAFDAAIGTSYLQQLLAAEDKLLFPTEMPTSRFVLPTQLLWSRDANGQTQAIAETTHYFATEEVADASPSIGSYDVWKTDGTRSGTDFQRYGIAFNPFYESPQELGAPAIVFGPEPVTIGSTTYSVRSTVAHGAELWASSGPEERLVKDILPGPFGSNPRDMVVIDDIIYFSARDRTTLYRFGAIEQEHEENWELWRSDGTEAGTYKLLEINPDVEAWPFSTSSSHARDYIPLGTGFLFNAKFDGELNGGALGSGRGWFTSDGTTDGTIRIPALDGLSELLLLPDQVVMLGKGGIWLTDGTAQGTRRIWELDGEATVRQVGALDQGAFFTVTDDGGTNVFYTDGTTAGTRLMKTILGAGEVSKLTSGSDVTLSISGQPFEPGVDSAVLFRTHDLMESTTTIWTATPSEVLPLQTFDGEPTISVRPASVGMLYTVGNSNAPYIYQDGDLLSTAWYRGESQEVAGSSETWIVNAESQQSYEIHRFDEFEFGARAMTMVDGLGYFSVENEELGYELWVTDGTQSGTQVYDLAPGADSSFPRGFAIVNGDLYFTVFIETDEDDTTPVEQVLMKIDANDEPRGDVDGDGKVDFADFLKLSANFGKQDQAKDDGDLDGDGNVAFADFLILSANFGRQRSESTKSWEPTQRNLENVEIFFALYSR